MSLAVAEPRVDDELALFHRTLAELCRSDVPLPEAFRILQADIARGRFKEAVRELAQDVENGVPLGEAYARRKKRFPPLYCALVEAGMVSGDLPGVLDEISRDAARRADITHRLKKALAYPLMTALVVLLVGGALFWIAPTTRELTEAMTGESPPPVPAIALGALACVVAATLLYAWRKGTRLPIVGPLRAQAAKCSFASTMALLLRRNVPLPAALDLASEASGSGVAKRVRAMAVAAHGGAGLSDALAKGELLEPSVAWLVEAAERSGCAADAFDDIAEIYRRRLDRGVERMTILVTPLAELVVGVVVFCCAFGYLLPLLRWTSELS